MASGARLGDGCVQFRYVESVMVSGARLGDGCVQFRCVESVMVHRTSVSGTRLGDNLGVWSQ